MFSRMIRGEPTEKVIFEKRLKEGKGVNHTGTWAEQIAKAKTVRQDHAWNV